MFEKSEPQKGQITLSPGFIFDIQLLHIGWEHGSVKGR